ncbi:unnamed protein product [Brugia timori]|uniref:Uncharacterized protein n=1 Tax=Brugia timori TaxID=42155 RepID=A0A0R3QKT4_9BILA|nr:unnamed protein product [Brugia timori]
MSRNTTGNNDEILSSMYHTAMNRRSSRSLLKYGSSDKEVSHICESSIVDKEHLASICTHLCNQLKTIINLLIDFAGDVCDESATARSLLCELEDKVMPFLVNLDIEMASSEKLIRINIDTARISETKVDWLLKFNKCKVLSDSSTMNSTADNQINLDFENILLIMRDFFFIYLFQLEMREMLATLSGAVYKDLERVLSLRCRGCCGMIFKKELMLYLYQMKKGTDKLYKEIKLEQTALIH